MPKTRTHNEWFMSVSLGGRKSCPNCKAKLPAGESCWAWGEYHSAKWQTVKHFCRACFPTAVVEPLLWHAAACRCEINLCARGGYSLPDWLRLTPCPSSTEVPAAATKPAAGPAS